MSTSVLPAYWFSLNFLDRYTKVEIQTEPVTVDCPEYSAGNFQRRIFSIRVPATFQTLAPPPQRVFPASTSARFCTLNQISFAVGNSVSVCGIKDLSGGCR